MLTNTFANQLPTFNNDLTNQLTKVTIKNLHLPIPAPLATDCQNVVGATVDECQALLSIYGEMGGTAWITQTGWAQTNTPCSWYGVGCAGGRVTSLHLGSNNLTGTIPSAIGDLTALVGLHLPDNQITAIHPNIGQLKSLTWLSLWENQIDVLPAEIGDLKSLQRLQIRGNSIETIPDSISQLTNLIEFGIPDNLITEIPSAVCSLTSLVELNIYTNQIDTMPICINQLTNLKEFRIGNNNLTGPIPDALCALTQLEILWLHINQITALPDCIGNLTNLIELYAYQNQIEEISTEIKNLTNLRILSFSNNQISFIPTEIQYLTNLETLGLHTNQITVIPWQIRYLTKLIEFNIYSNQISEIPTEIQYLTNLRFFRIANNQIEGEVPTQLCALTQLEILWLHQNQITTLPDCIGQLINLIELYAYQNQIIAIPTSIGGLENLEILWLANNQITSIPTTIIGAIKLRELNLNFNRIEEAPIEIASLNDHLTMLRLRGNQLLTIDPAFCAMSLQYFDLAYNRIDPDTICENVTAPASFTTQTRPPTNLTATTTRTNATLTFTPPTFNTLPGQYITIFYSLSPGGPYTVHGTTSVTATSYTLDNLPINRYYVVIQNHTPAHSNNPFPLESVYSEEIVVTIAPPENLVINEVDADTAPQPINDNSEFIELYDGGIGNSTLTGYVVVLFNGNGDLSYHVVDLDNYTTDSNGYFIIGAPGVAGADITIPANTIQNGADAVALYQTDASDFPNGSAVTTLNLVDALVYDTSDTDDASLLVLLNANQPQVNENGNGNGINHSNQRCPDGSGGERNTNTYTQDISTPRAENCRSADLSLAIQTTPPMTMSELTTFTYTVSLTNSANSHMPADGVEVSVYLPDTATQIEYLNNDCGASIFDNTLTWSVGTILTGTTTICTIDAQVRTGTNDTFLHTYAEVSATTTPDPDSTAGNFNTTPLEDDEADVTVYIAPPAPCPNGTLTAIYALALDTTPDSDLSYLWALGALPKSFEIMSQTACHQAIVLVDMPGPDNTFIRHFNNGTMSEEIGLPDFTAPITTPVTLSTQIREYDMTAAEQVGLFYKWARQEYVPDINDATHREIIGYIGHGAPIAPDTLYETWDMNQNLMRNEGFTPLFPLPIRIDGGPNAFTDMTNEMNEHAPSVLAVTDLADMLAIATDEGTNPVDILDLLKCFAGSLEELFEIAPYTEIVMGSPTYAYISPHMVGNAYLLVDLATAPIPSDIATTIAGSYDHTIRQAGDTEHPRLITVIDTTAIPIIVNHMRDIAWYLNYEFNKENNQATVVANLRAAYHDENNAYYDTTCTGDYAQEPGDALVDLHAFTQALADIYPALSIAVDGIDEELASTILAVYKTNGHPWFAPVNPQPEWVFNNHRGISLWADFDGVTLDGKTYLHWNTNFYTDETFPENENPYEFVKTTEWDNLLQNYWDYIVTTDPTVQLTTTVCLPALPSISYDVDLYPVGLAIDSTYPCPRVGIPCHLSANIAADGFVSRPTVELRVIQDDNIVFSNTINIRYLITGTQTLPDVVWTPTEPGEYTIMIITDPDDVISETNELNNVWATDGTDIVFPPNGQTPPNMTIDIGDLQWFHSMPITITLEQLAPTTPRITIVDVCIFYYPDNSNPSILTPIEYGCEEYRGTALNPTSELAITIPPELANKTIIIQVWGRSGHGQTVQPAKATFNYTPANAIVDSGKFHYFLYTVEAGDTLFFDLEATVGDPNIFVWDPYSFGTPIYQGTDVGSDQLSVIAQFSGTYIVGIYGETDAIYTLNTIRNDIPDAFNKTPYQKATPNNNAYIPQSRPHFASPPATPPPATHVVATLNLPDQIDHSNIALSCQTNDESYTATSTTSSEGLLYFTLPFDQYTCIATHPTHLPTTFPLNATDDQLTLGPITLSPTCTINQNQPNHLTPLIHGLDTQFNWTPSPNATAYELWFTPTPYTLPTATCSTSPTCILTSNLTTTHPNTIGHPTQNYFYYLIPTNTCGTAPPSNHTATFNYALTIGN
ncbi:MAG TPA: leucine-rich repeat domain-containing protein [Anaerolineae bacterium]|nr:leucine-rich repeat domain-containing protein [Anaerolineae bacterium]